MYLYSVDVESECWGVSVNYYRCDSCGKIECNTEDIKSGEYICNDCLFISGEIDEREYLSKISNGNTYFIDRTRACVYEGKVYTTHKKRFPFEAANKDLRATPEYAAWRKAVFERDKYTCKICGQKGGELQAHHIKPFVSFVEDRYDVNNGTTLCMECHKSVHRNKPKEWLVSADDL